MARKCPCQREAVSPHGAVENCVVLIQRSCIVGNTCATMGRINAELGSLARHRKSAQVQIRP